MQGVYKTQWAWKCSSWVWAQDGEYNLQHCSDKADPTAATPQATCSTCAQAS
jgi:hypothetical protein